MSNRSNGRAVRPERLRHRENGLRRVSQVTGWSLAGGLALTGGLSVVAAQAYSGAADAPTSGMEVSTTPTVPVGAILPGLTPTTGRTTVAARATATTATTVAAAPVTAAPEETAAPDTEAPTPRLTRPARPPVTARCRGSRCG